MTFTELDIENTKFNEFLINMLPVRQTNLYIADRILDVVSSNNAIIAGGALTNVLMPNPIPIKDIDIYVNVKDSQNLLNSLLEDNNIMKDYTTKNYTCPVYDRSFMLRNNILGGVCFYYDNQSYIEVMIVKDKIPLKDVVENFDLTFCKVWTDGYKIFTHYMDDIHNMNGKLGHDYLKAFLQGNTYTYERLKKYNNKGFSINFPDIKTSNITFKKHKKKVVSEKEWASYFILKNLIGIVSSRMSTNDFFISFDAYVLQQLSRENSDKIYNLNSVMKIIENIYKPSFDDVFNLNTAVYGLIMYGKNYYLKLCEWVDTKNLEYFEKYGIKVLPDSNGPSHGFNNEPWDFCNENTYIQDKLTKVDMYNLYELFQKEYPDLPIALNKPERNLSAAERLAQQQEQMRMAAKRFADPNEENEIIEEDEEGMYTTPSGKEVPARCFNMTEGGNINTSKWASEKGNILFLVESAPGLDPDLVCTNVNELKYALRENTGILYRCGGTRGNRAGDSIMVDDVAVLGDVSYDLSMANVDKSIEYIPFVYDLDGNTVVKGYLPRKDIELILDIAMKEDTNLPVVSLNFVDTISHTVGKDVMSGGSMIGANHCQAGSTIAVFKLDRSDLDRSGLDRSDLDRSELDRNPTIGVDIIPREDTNIETPPLTEFTSEEDAADFILEWIDVNNNPGENIVDAKIYFGNGIEVPSFINGELWDIYSRYEYLGTLLTPLFEKISVIYETNKNIFINNTDNGIIFWVDMYLRYYPFTVRVLFFS